MYSVMVNNSIVCMFRPFVMAKVMALAFGFNLQARVYQKPTQSISRNYRRQAFLSLVT